MQDLANKKIILGLCGGIAVYKVPFLVRELIARGAVLRIVMTAAAEEFIRPLTLQALGVQAVHSQLFDVEAEQAMGHIELARWADYLVIVPASANSLAKMANGFADDLLSTLYLATEKPVLICPAMNKHMWAHPAVQANQRLLAERGAFFVGPALGLQACGDEGLGRMVEIPALIEALIFYPLRGLLAGKTVLITAGPTREYLDPVRYLSNDSSGKMGYALARAAAVAGARVILISGPTHLAPPFDVETYGAESAAEMAALVDQHLVKGAIFIGAAAVADFKFKERFSQKIKKRKQPQLNLNLEPNPDILKAVVQQAKAALVVGFAAETENLLAHAKEKLVSKQLDMIIANQVGPNLGFNVEVNQVTILTKNVQKELKLTRKTELAGQIIAIIAATVQNAGLKK